MSDAKLSGPDLAGGVALPAVADGAMLLGHAHGKPVLLARRGAGLFAAGARRTPYGGPPGQGPAALVTPLRPPEPVQGLPCRHGAGGVDSAAPGGVLPGTAHRSEAERARHRARRRPAPRAARRRQPDCL